MSIFLLKHFLAIEAMPAESTPPLKQRPIGTSDLNLNPTASIKSFFDLEIISLLKIDTNKWKLSQYWNKQMGDHWRVSALVTQIKNSDEKHFEDLLKNWKPKKRFELIKADEKSFESTYNPHPISLTPEFIKEIQSI